jgi:acetyl-CoA C-acetyltransferase
MNTKEAFTMTEVFLCAPARTAIGTFGGSLKSIPAVQLGANVVRAVLERSKIAPELVDSVILGQVVQAGAAMNPARQATIAAGLPVATPAMTVNRVCGSGLQSLITAAQEILSGGARCVVAGGMENMDQAPYLVLGGRWGYRMGDATLIDSMLHDGLNDAFSGKHSGWHTEDLVTRYKVSRADQDDWALRTQQRFAVAQAAGKFASEIVPVEIRVKGKVEAFERDEHNRPETTLETLAKLKPVFRSDGTITAGNSPGLNSGAAAMIVASREFAEAHGLSPFARIVAFGVAAVEPGYFGIAPVAAVRRTLERAGWRINDLERVEINEAFAAVALACIRELGLPEDVVNIEGGAIAHGHPIGATGAVLTTRLLHSMRRDGLKRGLVTLCIGGGQAVAMAVEVL